MMPRPNSPDPRTGAIDLDTTDPKAIDPKVIDDGDITGLLRAAADGDREQMDRLLTAVYDDLRRLAAVHLRSERSDHTFEPTALLHETYVKLVQQRDAGWNDRAHFFAFASTLIRRILIDHARSRATAKRGGEALRVTLVAEPFVEADDGLDLLDLDAALRRLAELDQRQARIVEMKYFGGCTVDDIAQVLGISRRTVLRDWEVARAWLYCAMDLDDSGPGRRDA